jgi:hypothetical protein
MRRHLPTCVLVAAAVAGTVAATLPPPNPVLAAQSKIADLEMSTLKQRVASLETEVARLKAAISVAASGTVTINAQKLKVNAAQLEVSSGIASFAGIIKGTSLQVDSVVAKSYTPGAGNVW